jgi:hydrogenase maturation protease
MSSSSSVTPSSARAARPAPDCPTVVLALGNPLRGDDGAGPAVLERLAATGVPDDVELVDGGLAGLEAVLHLDHRTRAIILDAADFGAAAGTWRRVHVEDIRLASPEETPGLHAAGLREALLLGDALCILPAEIILYLIQPREIGWGEGLSAEVHACLDAVCRAVRSELCGGIAPSANPRGS